jgi:RNA polymerase sigma-70 factor (ECF subfamily)
MSVDDDRVFEALFDRDFDAVWRYIRRRIGADLADELAAETFARAYEGWSRFDPARGDPRAWLFGIATNLLRRHARDERRRFATLAHELAVDDYAGPAFEVHALVDLFSRLSLADREVLFLFCWADLTYEQVAAALEVPVGTVRSRLNRARASARRLWTLCESEAADG